MNQMKSTCEPRATFQDCDTTITLSDSDSDSLYPFLMEVEQKSKRKKIERPKRKAPANKESNMVVDLSSTILIEDSEESEDEHPVQKRSKDGLSAPVEFTPLNAEKEGSMKFVETNGKTNSSTKVNVEVPIPSIFFSHLDNAQMNGNASVQNTLNDTINLCDSPPRPDFTSLTSEKEKENIPNEINDSDILKDEIPRPHTIVHKFKCLRPVAIDGSNVARAHGKVQNTFSCKGIKIAIDYFLQRGHQQVIAFLPHFHIKKQEHKKPGSVLTTDQFLLKELEKEQHIVLTPSRCYDDRFIVEYATKTGAVILSNDNYRDIAGESDEYKKTIDERLLMFCFVGDIIMIPHDPLGRNGPSLEKFLSFPT